MNLANLSNIQFEINRNKLSMGIVIRKIICYLNSELTRNIKEYFVLN